MDTQAGLCLCCSHAAKSGLVVSRPNIILLANVLMSFYSRTSNNLPFPWNSQDSLRMDLPTLISRKSPFKIIGVLGGVFHFFPNFNRTFCKQTVKILIRHRIMQCLIWVCTVCLCLLKRTLGLYRVKITYYVIVQKFPMRIFQRNILDKLCRS